MVGTTVWGEGQYGQFGGGADVGVSLIEVRNQKGAVTGSQLGNKSPSTKRK